MIRTHRQTRSVKLLRQWVGGASVRELVEIANWYDQTGSTIVAAAKHFKVSQATAADAIALYSTRAHRRRYAPLTNDKATPRRHK